MGYVQLYTQRNYASKVYSDAAVVYLQFVLHVMLLCTWNMLWTFTLALSDVSAVPNVAVFCSSLISCLRGLLYRYCLKDFEMVPVNGATFAFTFHMCWISIIKVLYFRIFSSSFLITLKRLKILAKHSRRTVSYIPSVLLLLSVILVIVIIITIVILLLCFVS